MKEIVQDGALVLREQAQPIPKELFGSAELTRLIESMKVALDRELEGVALAAPQIGVSYRVFIVRKDRAVPPPEVVLESEADTPPVKQEVPLPQVEIYINPEIVKTSRRKALAEEGCLSVRGVYGTTRRHERATVRAQDVDGSVFERGGGGIMAQIFEHEIDHLNGVLFTDHAEQLIHIKHAPTA